MNTLRIVRAKLRHAVAVMFLVVIAVASAGQSARVGGEIGAVLQNPGTRPVMAMLIATPLLMSMRKRGGAKVG